MITESKKKELVIQRLKRYRIERQWTLQYTADLIEVTPAQVSRYETGKSKPGSLTLYRIEQRLPGLIEDVA